MYWGACACANVCACLRSFMKPETQHVCLSVAHHWSIILLVPQFLFVRTAVVSILLVQEDIGIGMKQYTVFFFFFLTGLLYVISEFTL
jgi:hypothetical protein